VAQGLRDGLVGVLELDVLADQGDPHWRHGGGGALYDLPPDLEVRRARVEAELLEDEVVDALIVVPERHLVDVVDVLGGHDRLEGQRREQRDLAADVGDSSPSERHRTMSGWMPMRRSSLTECCVGLVLSSPACRCTAPG
jgi:hypothetical protein